MSIMTITTGLWWLGAVPGASLPGLALTLALSLTFLVLLLALASGSGLAFALGSERRHLRLVLRSERCLSLIEINLGDGGCCHRDLLGRVEDLVSGFEDGFISFTREVFVTDVSPNIYWKLQ